MSAFRIRTSRSEIADQRATAEKFEILTRIVTTDLGEPDPVDRYRHQPEEAILDRLKTELENAERAQADAAARLHTLYAD